MSLRPISLSIQSSTKIKILFSEDLSSQIDKTNVYIESISSSDALNIKEISVDRNILTIISEPQSEGEYYQITLKSSDSSQFKSITGKDLVNDSVSRKIFFIGSENYNPVRDRMILNAPSNYNLESGLIRDFLSANADEIYKAQRASSELLSDNYIRQESVDEIRTRGNGPRDRFVNEGVFKIKRVSKNKSGSSNLFKTIDYSSNSTISRHNYVSTDPVSLQEVYFEQEISSGQLEVFKKNEILTLENNNVIKILRIIAVSGSEEKDYSIEEYKYSIKNNRYDSNFSFSDSSLESNQLYLSSASNLGDIFSYDKLIVQYLCKDRTILPQGEVEVFEVVDVSKESVPYQKNNFYLKNFNICDSSGGEIAYSGLTFSFIGSDTKPYEFAREIPFSSKIPSSAGEYSVNYETGEVRLYGTDGSGVEVSGIAVSYFYKRIMTANFDYYIVDNDIVFNKKRLVINNNPKINFEYENVFEEGVHYKNMSHVEVLNERVGANMANSFSIKAKNGSINNVFRIKNATTGELYSYLYSIGNKIFFSGSRSPEISNFKEFLNPKETFEKLYVSSESISKIQKTKITSINGNLVSVPSFSVGNINTTSSEYFLYSNVTNTTISILSIINSGGFITGFVLDQSATIPPLNSEVFLSLKLSNFTLSNSNILDSSGTKIGDFSNSSCSFDSDLFKKEIHNSSFQRPGDYSINYKSGEISLAANSSYSDFGGAKYLSGKYYLSKRNPITLSEVGRGSTQYFNNALYEDFFISSDIESIVDFSYPVNKKFEIDIENEFIKINKVLLKSDFENGSIVELPYTINSNVISFKNSYLTKYREDSSFYYFDLKDSDLFFEIRTKENVTVIDSELKMFIENIYYKNIISKDTKQDIYLINKDITKKISKGDIIVNNGYNFVIISFNKLVGTITVTPEVEGIVLNPSYSMECYSKLSINNNVIKINKNIKNLSNDVFTIFEKTSLNINIGDDVYIDFHLLPIYAEYKFLKDEIYISYEYGDNEIEWIDQDAILSGEDYFVTYEYGAMREKLKSNFGDLTKIPFFTKFPISVDREFYRDALEGALQSFVKGPTIDSIQSVTKSIVKTTPDIDEHFYKNWILSRDHLCENKISYGGNLKFAPIKFKEGMLFGDGNYVEISADSSISIEEGSMSCWIRNDWNGIDNDANIFFDFYSLGISIFALDLKDSIFSSVNDLENIVYSDTVGLTSQNKNKISLYNWDLDSSGKKYGNYSIAKKLDQYSAGVDSLFNFRKSVPFSKIEGMFLNDKIEHSSVIINDGTRIFSLDLVIENAYSIPGTLFYITDKNQDLIPTYYKDSNYIRCKCNTPDLLDDYLFIKDKITEIEVTSGLFLSDFKNGLTTSEMIEYCFIADDNENIYKVVGVSNTGDEINSIKILSLPVNRGNVYSRPLEFRNMFISGSFKIFFAYETIDFISGSSYESINSGSLLNYKKFDTTYEYEVGIDAKTNTLSLTIDNRIYNLFYTDLKRVNDYLAQNLTFMLSDSDRDLVASMYGINFLLKNGSVDKELDIFSLRIETQGVLSKDDIYLGPSGVKPKMLNNFSINKNDFSGFGTVNTSLYEKGLFIGVIENNTGLSDLGESLWLFRFKAPEYVRIASSVSGGVVSYEYVRLNYRLDGKISTDGEFSFVSPLSLPIPGYDLVDSGHRKYYKFSGFNKLETDGWNAVYSLNGDDDFAAEFYKWIKVGEFLSENSIYKISNIGPESSILTNVSDENKDITISFTGKITVDQNFKTYSQIVSSDKNVYLLGISPLKYYDEDCFIDIEVGINDDLSGVLLFKDKDGSILDFNNANWNNGLFNSIKIVKKDYVDIYFNETLLNRFSFAELPTTSVASRVLGVVTNRYSVLTNNIIEISSYEYLSTPRYFSSFQDNDKFYSNDKEIEFSLYLNEILTDGYQDEYSANTLLKDGYVIDDIDEFVFVADKNRYIFNSYGNGMESIGLYKSGKGFLTFKITDKDGDPYTVESNIKSFKSGEIHHIGASWAINTDSGDEMHLFIDGDEAPNLVRFGSDIPIDMFDKFSDPEKEVLQNFVVKDISFEESILANVSARSNLVVLNTKIDSSYVGRSFLVNSSDLDPTVVGKAIVINEVSEDGFSFYAKDLDNMQELFFQTSSTLSISLAPSVGFGDRRIFTNMKHQKFRVFIDDQEVGVSLFGKDETGAFEIDSDLAYSVAVRAFPEINCIEFIKKDNGVWVESVSKDSMVHIKSYGLSLIQLSETIDISSEYSSDGVSLIRTNLPSPIDYKDVVITKVIEPRFIPDFEIISEGEV